MYVISTQQIEVYVITYFLSAKTYLHAYQLLGAVYSIGECIVLGQDMPE